MIKQHYSIAILITCHNRKEKTIKGLKSIIQSADNCTKADLELTFFVTIDGCTDGTLEALETTFYKEFIHFIMADGNAFWAGGMRLAWDFASKYRNDWDFYLLFNDDTQMEDNCFDILLDTYHYSLDKYGKAGVYAGLICSNDDNRIITYGGKKYKNRFWGRAINVIPKGSSPQECLLTNANILLVSTDVYRKLGILDNRFKHSCADWDYGVKAARYGFPVLVTSQVCGKCDNDHRTDDQLREAVLSMTICERRSFFGHPLRSTSDILLFMKKNYPLRYPLVLFARFLNIYCPRIYYHIIKIR